MGINVGKAAGAGVAGHIHMHVLPRWVADANFMTSVGETRVLPEDLDDDLREAGARVGACVGIGWGTNRWTAAGRGRKASRPIACGSVVVS